MPTKTGRNDPCPCGSGKKFKHCCLGNTGFSDEPTAMERLCATDTLNELRAIAGNREFKSQAEFEAFLESYMAIKNNQPVEDFAGLSPDDIENMLYDRDTAIERLISIKGPIPTEETASVPVLRAAIAPLRELSRGPVPMTASGYIAPDVARRWFDEAFALEETPRVREMMRPKSESDYFPLIRFRTCLCLAGFAEKRSAKLSITEKGSDILEREDWQTLYRELFRAMIELYNDTDHPVNSRMMDGAGEYTLFALRLIDLCPSDTIAACDLCAAYARAFPRDFNHLGDDGLRFFVYADAILPARMEDYPNARHETVAKADFGKRYVAWKK